MDALCLFEPSSLRIMGANSSWALVFGYAPGDAIGMTIKQLLASVDELLAQVPTRPGPATPEANGRTTFRRSDGTQFTAPYAVTTHLVGPSSLACLLVHAPMSAEVASQRSISLIEDEVISQTGVPVHLKAAMKERMARCNRQQTALLQLASADDNDIDALTKRILKTDSETLDISRVSYWAIRDGGKAIYCEELYDAKKGGFERGIELFAKDFPIYFRALVTGALIPAYDALTDSRTSEFAEPYLKPLNIGAMLDIPVFVRGELVGVVCHEHVGSARGWTMDEQQFALSIGQMFSLALAARQREQAAQSLQNRDVMLAEANAQLDRALKPNDGQLTGKTLGRYRLQQMVGRGGVGEVYQAVRAEDNATLAVKVLRRRALERPEQVQRFFREARMTASVPSDHVAQIFEVGTFDDGMPFIAMELLEGHDLSWHLRRTTQLGLEQVVELCDHTSRALAAVREAGVVHRDLKPSNLFLVDAIPRAWKVLDFGLSRSDADPFTTVAEEVSGTPHYMAPEQICGDPTDHRTDLYALATIAYRALTGRPPYVGDMQAILFYSALTESPPSVTSLVRGVPIEIDLVFAIALAKDPDSRFPRVEAFAEAFRGAAKGQLDESVRAAGWKLLKAAPAASA